MAAEDADFGWSVETPVHSVLRHLIRALARPNTYTMLQAFARSNIVELVLNKEPQHWRLARRYRPNSDAFIGIAGQVRRGE